MTTSAVSKWIVPVVGLALGLLVAAAELGRGGGPGPALIAFAIVAGYALLVGLLRTRSDTLSLLSGMPVDERWTSINVRALSVAAVAMAVVIAGAFLVTRFGGGDAQPYAWLGAVFAASYLAGILWYRWRS